MAEIGNMTFTIKVTPDDDSMGVILTLLNLWQDSHPDQMVAMVPRKDKYVYEIINRGGCECRGD